MARSLSENSAVGLKASDVGLIVDAARRKRAARSQIEFSGRLLDVLPKPREAKLIHIGSFSLKHSVFFIFRKRIEIVGE